MTSGKQTLYPTLEIALEATGLPTGSVIPGNSYFGRGLYFGNDIIDPNDNVKLNIGQLLARNAMSVTDDELFLVVESIIPVIYQNVDKCTPLRIGSDPPLLVSSQDTIELVEKDNNVILVGAGEFDLDDFCRKYSTALDITMFARGYRLLTPNKGNMPS
jgi:hypothetical protein